MDTLSDWNSKIPKNLKLINLIAKSSFPFFVSIIFSLPQKTFSVNQFWSKERMKLHCRESNFKNFLGKILFPPPPPPTPYKFVPAALNAANQPAEPLYRKLLSATEKPARTLHHETEV